METTYDVIVIGAGAVGENAADYSRRTGLSVAVVESELVGGECSYWACIPSKTLLNPGKILEEARRAPGVSAAVTGKIDVKAALRRRNDRVDNWDDTSQVKWLTRIGATLIRGYGRLAGERTVKVTDSDGRLTTYRATSAVVVATGSTPLNPDIGGLEDLETWTSRDITSSDSVPGRIVFIGGGSVGVEMAQAWAWLGSEVTLIHQTEHLLSPEEPFAGSELRQAFEEMGITVHTEADTKLVKETGAGGVVAATVQLANGDMTEIEADEIVIATGRGPRTDDLGLETVGLEPGQFLEVDEHMRVQGIDSGWLYAVGDVNGRALLTHMGKYQARIAGAHISGKESAAVTPVPSIPRVIFTSPEIAAVGQTESQAREGGIQVDTVTHDIGQVAGTTILGEGYSGTVKLVIDRRRQVVIGATFVGPRAGEMVHAATVAIVGEVPLDKLWHAVPSFPTLSEVWLRLLENHLEAGWDPYRV